MPQGKMSPWVRGANGPIFGVRPWENLTRVVKGRYYDVIRFSRFSANLVDHRNDWVKAGTDALIYKLTKRELAMMPKGSTSRYGLFLQSNRRVRKRGRR